MIWTTELPSGQNRQEKAILEFYEQPKTESFKDI